MKLSNSAFCVLVALAVSIVGCGRQERLEGVQLAKALTAKKADFAASNATEKDFVDSARAWCAGITTNGAGRGPELDQNSSVALQIAKTAVAVSAQLSQVRQAVDAQTLSAEFPKQIRNTLITDLTKRQRTLQDMRALLEQSAPQFLDYKAIKSYAGDTYPDGIGKLNTMLGTYKEPEDVIATALKALKEKYSLTDSEL